MKTIGLLGGMSWESTSEYYRILNETVKERLGGLHSARILLHSVDFHEIETLQHEGRWQEAGDLLSRAANGLERAGADLLLICTNTMHKVAPQIEAALSIPLLHIADPTAEALKQDGISKVGLLGTAFTMEDAFYKGRLEERHGLSVVIPEKDDRALIHTVIFEELCKGILNAKSREKFHRIISKLAESGAGAVILGCTEIGSLVADSESQIPLFDTTWLHARKAVEKSLETA